MASKQPTLAKLAGGKGKTVRVPVQDAQRVVVRIERDNPVHRFVAQLRDKTGIDYKTTAEVASDLGVSTNWIRKVKRQGVLGVPSMATKLGKVEIYLYTPDDVDKIRQYLVERQSVFTLPQGRADTWEEVVSRRERTSQAEDSA
jgi:hypothetical protein